MGNKYDCFTGKAEIYSKSWPQFGKQYSCLIKEYATKINAKIAFDIACGTGLHTKSINTFFDKVYAVEPNIEMLDYCRQNLHAYKNIIYVNSTAEDLQLINSYADIIFVAQAFNLLDHGKVKISFAQKLKRNGLVVIAWNNKTKHSIFNDIAAVSTRFCPSYDDECYKFQYASNSLDDFFKFKPHYYKLNSDVPSYLDRNTFLSRCTSTSYALDRTNPNFKLYLSELEHIFNNYQENGVIYYPLDTTVYIGEI